VEHFGETFGAVIVFPGEAVYRKNEAQVGIGEAGDVGVSVIGLTPSFLVTVIAVLQDESTGIEGIVYFRCGTAGPPAQFGLRVMKSF